MSGWEQTSPAGNKERHQTAVEDDWEKAIPPVAGKSDDWASPNLVDSWYPPAPKANVSLRYIQS